MRLFHHRHKSTNHLFCLLATGLLIGLFATLEYAADAAKTAKPVPSKAQSRATAQLPPLDQASWIWSAAKDDQCHLRTTIVLDETPEAASILITADNGYELAINGAKVGFDIGAGAEIWQSVERFDIAPLLNDGQNIIGIHGVCLGGARGVIAAVRLEFKNGQVIERVTDASWRAAPKGDLIKYSHMDFVEGAEWRNANPIAKHGSAPWGRLKASNSKGGRRTKGGPARVDVATPDESFVYPKRVAFIGDDCSVYVPQRGDAWGVCFRVETWSRAYTEFDLPCPVKIGRKLYALSPGEPDAQPRLLLDAGSGALGSPSAGYDGRFIYFSMAREGGSFFHIYRMPAEGGEPVQLTDGPFHDIDPVELPDGRLVFSSTRIGTFEEYHSPPSQALYVMNADGGNIHPITFTPIFDREPKVMADGRIAFVRTDNFFGRGKIETLIHAIRPDGTNGQTEAGAQVGPDYGGRLRNYGYGSPAPLPDGRLAYISNRGNAIVGTGENPKSMQPLPRGLGDLAPLPDGRLLATVLQKSGRNASSNTLAVFDPQTDRLTGIYESPTGSIHSPIYLADTPRPRAIPDYVDPEQASKPLPTGFLGCQNVYQTLNGKADWGRVKAIRVLGALGLTTRSSHSHIVHAGHETVELGTAPIAPDGSFYIEVPADMPLALQAVDAEGRSELNEMSWIYVRPGENRMCIGCHAPREKAALANRSMAQAFRSPALKLLGQGRPHRFRGNNAGVTGMMDLQFERFREVASLNRFTGYRRANLTGKQVVDELIEQLTGHDAGLKISAANRLGIFRDRDAAAGLAEMLSDDDREIRAAAALALSACGTRQSIPPLLRTLSDRDAQVARAAAIALENLTGHTQDFQPYANPKQRKRQAQNWQDWFKEHPWPQIEAALIEQIHDSDRVVQRRAIVALGHIGGERAKTALRNFVNENTDKSPYPPFQKNNRTDRFTYPADSPYNPRTLQEAVRALGYLNDTEAIDLLRQCLMNNLQPDQANLYLAEAVVEALGRIDSPHSESILIEAFGKLGNYWTYVGWYSDHPALYACHSSPVHARIIEMLDRIGSEQAGPIVPALIRSVPTDPDRALFPQNDDYETLVGRVIRRSGRADAVIETCLSLLGDPQARPDDQLRKAISTTFACWAGTPAPDNRAAQILSLTCRHAQYEPRVRAAYERYRAAKEDPIKRPLNNPKWIPQRHWVLFFLGRALGNIGDPPSVKTLLASLSPQLHEARHGRPDPVEPNIHFLQLEYTPCWRTTAAWALGRIGDRRAGAPLMDVIRHMNNAIDVRHAAAEAMGNLADPNDLPALRTLAESYPEYSVQRALKWSCLQAVGQPVMREEAP